MDRNEYNLKIEEIKIAMHNRDYAKAAEVADSIDYRKERANDILSIIADAYEMTRQYEKAKEALIVAYENTNVGRQLAYRLCLLSLKLKQFEEADEFYQDFVEMAPRDTAKYVLKYKIAKASGMPLDYLIEILEDYIQVDMEEKWAYELAKLYHLAGDHESCVDVCDEISLWFAEGKYVNKAMELKMLYKPLNQIQLQRYNEAKSRQEEKTENPVENEVEADLENSSDETPNVSVRITSEEEKQNDMGATKMFAPGEAADASATKMFSPIDIDNKSANDIADLLSSDIEVKPIDENGFSTMDLQAVVADGMKEIFEEKKEDKPIETPESVGMTLDNIYKLEGDGQIGLDINEPELKEKQITGQLSIEEVLKNLQARGILKADTVEGAVKAMDEIAQVAGQATADVQKQKEEDLANAVIVEEITAKDLGLSEQQINDELAQVKRGLETFAAEAAADVFIPDLDTDAIEEEIKFQTGEISFANVNINEELNGTKIERKMPEINTLKEETEIDNRKEDAEELPAPEEVATPEETPIFEELSVPEENLISDEGKEDIPEVDISVSDEGKEDIPEVEIPVLDEDKEDIPEMEIPILDEEIENETLEEVEVPTEEDIEVEDVHTEKLPKITKELVEDAVQPALEEVEALMNNELEIDIPPVAPLHEVPFLDLSFDMPIPKTTVVNEDGTENEIEKTQPLPSRKDMEEVIEEHIPVDTERAGEEVSESSSEGEYVEVPETSEEDNIEEVPETLEEDNIDEVSGTPEEDIEEVIETPEEDIEEVTETSEEMDEVEAAPTEEVKDEFSNVEAVIVEEEVVPELDLSESEETNKEETKPENCDALKNIVLEPEKAVKSNKKFELTDSDMEVFSNYTSIEGVEETIRQTIENLVVGYEPDGCSGNGNVLIEGDGKSGKTTLAIEIIRLVNAKRERKGRKIAKIDAQILNRKGLEDSLSKLLGNDLIVENAGKLEEDVLEEFEQLSKTFTDDMIIVFEDGFKKMNHVFDGRKELKKMFDNVIKIKQYDVREWVAYGKNYANTQGYIVDDMGTLALFKAVDDWYGNNQEINQQSVEAIINEAISKSNKKVGRKIGNIFSSNKDVKVLKESDFNI